MGEASCETQNSPNRLVMETFVAYVECDPETKLYVGVMPGIRGAHTQGATLDEL